MDSINFKNLNLFTDDIIKAYKNKPLNLSIHIYPGLLENASLTSQCEVYRWVEDKTLNKIKGLLPPGSIDAGTRMALVNAAYFKGINFVVMISILNILACTCKFIFSYQESRKITKSTKTSMWLNIFPRYITRKTASDEVSVTRKLSVHYATFHETCISLRHGLSILSARTLYL